MEYLTGSDIIFPLCGDYADSTEMDSSSEAIILILTGKYKGYMALFVSQKHGNGNYTEGIYLDFPQGCLYSWDNSPQSNNIGNIPIMACEEKAVEFVNPESIYSFKSGLEHSVTATGYSEAQQIAFNKIIRKHNETLINKS